MKTQKWTGRVFLKTVLAATLAMFGAAALRSVPAPAEGAAPSYPQVVMADKPVAYWRLGEKAGAAVAKDEIGKHPGRYHGQPTFGEPSPIRANPATAVALDGKSYVEVPDSPDFSQPTTGSGKAGLTVEVWMRPDKLDFFGGQGGHEYTYWLGKGEDRQGRPKHNEWALRFYPKPNRISAYIFNPSGGEGAGAEFQPGGMNPPVTKGEVQQTMEDDPSVRAQAGGDPRTTFRLRQSHRVHVLSPMATSRPSSRGSVADCSGPVYISRRQNARMWGSNPLRSQRTLVRRIVAGEAPGRRSSASLFSASERRATPHVRSGSLAFVDHRRRLAKRGPPANSIRGRL